MNKTPNNDWLGCNDDDVFGIGVEPQHIDDIDEVNEVVEDLTEEPDSTKPEDAIQFDVEKVQLVGGIVHEYFRRQRLLTIAVIAIVIYLVLKEAN